MTLPTDYNTAPNANLSISGVYIGEQMERSDVNQALRAIIADIAVLLTTAGAGYIGTSDGRDVQEFLSDLEEQITNSIARSTYPNTAQSNVPRGAIGHGAITGGSGGANGTFDLAFSSGNFQVNPTGTFTVSGGAVTAITITGAGEYIGASPTAPTLSFAASSGLTGASASLTVGFLVDSGERYWTLSSDGTKLVQYQNVSGTATAVSPSISIATTISNYIDYGVVLDNPDGVANGLYDLRMDARPVTINRLFAQVLDGDTPLTAHLISNGAVLYGPFTISATGTLVTSLSLSVPLAARVEVLISGSDTEVKRAIVQVQGSAA